MNQNIPPNEQGYDSASGGYGEPGYDAGRNPYMAGDAPDAGASDELDANAPFLKSSEERKLNFRMLAFVVAALLLLIIIIVALWNRMISGGDKSPPPAKPEVVEVPDLPNAAPSPPMAAQPTQTPPIDLAPDAPLPPALPPASYGAGHAGDQRVEPMGPSLLDRRIADSGGGTAGFAGTADASDQAVQKAMDQQMQMQQKLMQQYGMGGQSTAQPSGQDFASMPTSAQPIRDPDTLLVRGTYIRCVLETRIITDVPGFTSCIVTEPVYSINGRKLLLPKGSKVLGSYDTEANGPRVAVIWDRITTPNGFDISMKSPGVDNLGSAGHPGKFTAHWPSRIASALMVSLVADAFKYAAAKNGPTQNEIAPGGVVIQSPYESVTAQTIQNMANRVVEKNMSRPATVIINQGTIVNVYVAKDVDFASVLPSIGG